MKLLHVIFVSLSLGLSGCAQETSFTETEQPPKIYPVLSIPVQGESLTVSLSSYSEILEELRKFSEDDYAAQNLETLSKRKALREKYRDSQIGSGNVFAISPNYERDYAFRQSPASSNIILELPTDLFLFYYCDDVPLDENHQKKCSVYNAKSKTKLSFHNATYNRQFELKKEVLNNEAPNIQSVYFVSFELPAEAFEETKSFASRQKSELGHKVEKRDSTHSYNLASSNYFDYSIKPPINLYTDEMIGNLHGVALVNSSSGKVLAYNSIQ